MENVEADEQIDSGRMPLWEHLDDLRGCLIRALIAVFSGILITYYFVDKIVWFLERPLLNALPEGEQQLYFTGIADKFITYIKVSLVAAIALVSPYLLYQVWRFVSPALYENERKMAVPFIFFGTLSFISGIAFAYFVVLPYSYEFLINFGSESDQAIITLTSYFSLTLKMILGVGLLFEIPVVLILLSILGILEAEILIKFRRHAVIALSMVAAIITPSPDAMTMLIVMVPLWGLYEISIIGVKIVSRKKRQKEQEEAQLEEES